MTKEEKLLQLNKYRKLNLVTLDYYIEHQDLQGFLSKISYLRMKKDIEINFEKGRLTLVKQSFRDFTEMQIETKDFEFNTYLKENTNYDIDIFRSFFKRIDKIIEKGKITTDNQFYDAKIMIDHLCQEAKMDTDKIEILNSLVFEYEQGKTKT